MIYIFLKKNINLISLTDHTDITDIFYRNNLLAKASDLHRSVESVSVNELNY